MSTRSGEDDSRPSQGAPRPTARDVPIAKYKEVSAGTVPPRGLRGPALQPGQGAPERINPEEIELAALREADTLDGPHVARAARHRSELVSSPPPTPVSVEVPRVRSVPPEGESYHVTPETPSARSIQSGTLMSIGSVDPRAPTELSLPSPRVLSQSERAVYLGPPAVVDRTPVSAQSAPRGTAPNAKAEFAPTAARAAPLNRDLLPPSSAPGVLARVAPATSSARGSQRADSSAPIARHFAREPDAYSPVGRTAAPSSAGRQGEPSSVARTSAPPESEGAPRFEIHAQLDAIPHELGDDNFDLRGVATTREPLASRKSLPSSDSDAAREPVSARRDSVPGERASQHPNSASAMTILVDPARESFPSLRDSAPMPEPKRLERATVPVSWVIGAATFALLLALIVSYLVRAPAPPEAARSLGNSAGLGAAQPSLPAALPAALPARTSAPSVATSAAVVSPNAEVAPSPSAAVSAKATQPNPHGAQELVPSASAAHSAQPAIAAPSASAHAADSHPAPATSSVSDAAKARQSIY
ncbi:MAG TPA: hypothetical protein VHV51_24390 [Polyangiaceae bacterium]|jgi:hypothetical protein|nr:hypothetical protein [Polyangiaceae bacterium]